MISEPTVESTDQETPETIQLAISTMTLNPPADQHAPHHTTSLLSNSPSDSGLHVHLHPLVLLTITDHLTRYVIRGLSSEPNPPPIVGALLGRQCGALGRETTLEQGFECKVVRGADGAWALDAEWFEVRLQQFKDVHTSPALDLVGWWTVDDSDILNRKGPRLESLPFHQHMLGYNKNAVLLVLHAGAVARSAASAPAQESMSDSISSDTPMQDVLPEGEAPNEPSSNLTITPGSSSKTQPRDDATAAVSEQLPMTIYESVYEEEHTNTTSDDPSNTQSNHLRFRVLPYSLATEEAEMVGVNTIVKTAGNASTIANTENDDKTNWRPSKKNRQDKQQASGDVTSAASSENVLLTRVEDDLLANLKTRLNALRTFDTRLQIIERYLLSVSSLGLTQTNCQNHLKHLRNVYSLITHLSLIQPPEPAVWTRDSDAQKNDVDLERSLLLLNNSISEMREVGKRLAGSGQTGDNGGGGENAFYMAGEGQKTNLGLSQPPFGGELLSGLFDASNHNGWMKRF